MYVNMKAVEVGQLFSLEMTLNILEGFITPKLNHIVKKDRDNIVSVSI